ncbi:mediator of RNA polymerase II transcription subunit 7 [Aaosphaeria arxii CBS 175.79]|uniref:Mediator of RNA polymerase II transcription subunit 7 n=1 Tax=Aaosphaeria arxii CBS 175.79 TaxID=1450172 RepID=A0A6A5XA11_9PLEO|nr:mediator of RNA polymerase II transcription subunit 7 [Aaosphaeria arxii CBS 175.79]KAF2009696.1 mediator of RNA polymerase II transcription subunit 7 [Aaosphaeria arxii CBS 175.79]
MADDEPQNAAPWPAPPPFYKFFTTENVENLKKLKNEAVENGHEASASSPLPPSRLSNLPIEQRYLVPPEPPADDEDIRVLGQLTKGGSMNGFMNDMAFIAQDLDHRGWLPGWQYEQLYPLPPETGEGEDPSTTPEWTQERKQYLFRLLRSALLSYLELLGVMAQDPASERKNEKIKDLLTLFANMHRLVNEYRPHQARETLIHLMEEQLRKKKAEIQGVADMKQKVDDALAELAKNAPGPATKSAADETSKASQEERRKDNQRQMWQAMDEILGH